MISDKVRRFLLTSVPSVPYLEAALLFHGAPNVERTRVEVARSLYLPEQRTEELLQALCAAGIVQLCSGSDAAYRYAPRDEALRATVAALALAYAADMIGVTHLIHDATRKDAQRFAAAFKLRKDR